ncbi:MAG: hydroxysqualene dehydroxylase HpnE [Candidatus Sulfotelmatobacter sp.]|jgi:zeta-carotene desaturase
MPQSLNDSILCLMIPSSSPSSDQPTVAVAGGGLAGLAAACALADAGFRVTLFEKRPFLGGRASSYEHPGTGEVVDNCQHVLLGCCTNLVEFYRRTGVEENIRWYDKLVFLEPGGRASFIAPSLLPAPLHTAPSFLRAACLGWRDKLAIARAMMILAGVLPDGGTEPFLARVRGETRGTPVFRDTGENFLAWLRRQHQTEQAIERFWKTILVSALNEDLDLVSVPYAAQVVRESFLKSAAGGRMGVPTVPLTDLYHAAGDYLRARGGVLQFRRAVEGFAASSSEVQVRLGNQEEAFDFLVIALPFDMLDRVLPDTPQSAPLREKLAHFESSPITGIHLWFDRQISDLDHAVLLDRTIQWMFHKSRLQPMRARPAEFPLLAKEARSGAPTDVGSYIELVVSSSKTLIDKSRSEIVDLALRELREFFPAAREAKLVKSTVIKEVNATYSPRPRIDAHRPGATTAWPRVFLAGDWTATGWPATMEGAVRSGYLAAEALARAAGRNDARLLSPDLPATGLMRMFE